MSAERHATWLKEGDPMEKSERVMSQQKGANTAIISDMIRLQIRLREVLARLEASPKRKVLSGARSLN
jgi:hypothetical protein